MTPQPSCPYNVPVDATPTSPSAPRRHTLIWVVLIGGLAVVLFADRLRPVPPSAVEWSHDWDAAVTRAAKTDRPLLVAFHIAGCPPCQEMKRDVYPRADVADALADWVPVLIEADDQPRVAAMFNVEAFPTYVAVTPTGQVIDTLIGGVSPAGFIRFIQVARARALTATAAAPE